MDSWWPTRWGPPGRNRGQTTVKKTPQSRLVESSPAMEAEEEARRAKEAGNDAYRKLFLETAVDHYTRGALLDPRDISFLTNRAAAYLLMGKHKECVRDCDDALERGRELRADKKLIARALSRKASALLKLAACAGDYAPAIRALRQSLAEHHSEETLAKLEEAESARKELEEQERLDREAADHHRGKGNEFFKQKKYHEAAMHYTQAMKMNPKDPRLFSNRAQCHIYLGALPQGLEDADKCIELDPTYLKGYVRKAKVQFLMENYENALETYLEGLRCDPNNLEVLDELRRCAACIKRPNGGDVELEDLKEMLKLYLEHVQRRSANSVVAPRYPCNNEDIDESSAEGLCSAESYAKANEMLIQVKVLGTKKTFWRLSDETTRISRKLALILRNHHSVGKCLTAPLQVSNVWIGSSGCVKLRGVSFTDKHFGIKCVRDDYKDLSRVLLALIRISSWDITKFPWDYKKFLALLPPDYKEFLTLLKRDTLTMNDEFLVVNNSALLPMTNRTEVFLMLYDRIVTYLGREPAGREKKKRILSRLPYKNDWSDTAIANEQIKQWVVNVKKQYEVTQLDQLRLNRNVRSHMHHYNDDNIEEILYCEWPELLMDMVKMLHVEGELEGTDIKNKFG
ncbi:hypothetical protein ACP70R_046777 [Stipagrostis hirtigluma subsp. patula]